MKKHLYFFKNKYLVATLLLLLWMLFLDKNDVFNQYDYLNRVFTLKEKKNFYTQEIEIIKKDIKELETTQEELETFAREKYLMKKPNEDIFVIVENK